MAVVRIKADKRWFRRAANAVEDRVGSALAKKGLARELRAAGDRPGKMAEITGAEAELLAEVLPTDERATSALAAARDSESRDRTAIRRRSDVDEGCAKRGGVCDCDGRLCSVDHWRLGR